LGVRTGPTQRGQVNCFGDSSHQKLQEFRSYRMGESDGVSGGGGEGEAFGNLPNRPRTSSSSSISFAGRGGWHRLTVEGSTPCQWRKGRKQAGLQMSPKMPRSIIRIKQPMPKTMAKGTGQISASYSAQVESKLAGLQHFKLSNAVHNVKEPWAMALPWSGLKDEHEHVRRIKKSNVERSNIHILTLAWRRK
jgi:hypothetical protein